MINYKTKFYELLDICNSILDADCIDDTECLDELAMFMYDDNGYERYPEDAETAETGSCDKPN